MYFHQEMSVYTRNILLPPWNTISLVRLMYNTEIIYSYICWLITDIWVHLLNSLITTGQLVLFLTLGKSCCESSWNTFADTRRRKWWTGMVNMNLPILSTHAVFSSIAPILKIDLILKPSYLNGKIFRDINGQWVYKLINLHIKFNLFQLYAGMSP